MSSYQTLRTAAEVNANSENRGLLREQRGSTELESPRISKIEVLADKYAFRAILGFRGLPECGVSRLDLITEKPRKSPIYLLLESLFVGNVSPSIDIDDIPRRLYFHSNRSATTPTSTVITNTTKLERSVSSPFSRHDHLLFLLSLV